VVVLCRRDRFDRFRQVRTRAEGGDKRFSDPTWKESSLHSSLLKAYLAWGEAVNGLVDKTSLSNIDKTRAHLITEILIDAVAPTNTMLTNPAAVRKFIDSGGQSLCTD